MIHLSLLLSTQSSVYLNSFGTILGRYGSNCSLEWAAIDEKPNAAPLKKNKETGDVGNWTVDAIRSMVFRGLGDLINGELWPEFYGISPAICNSLITPGRIVRSVFLPEKSRLPTRTVAGNRAYNNSDPGSHWGTQWAWVTQPRASCPRTTRERKFCLLQQYLAGVPQSVMIG